MSQLWTWRCRPPHVPIVGKVVGATQYFLGFPSRGEEIAGAYVPVRGWVWHPKGIETIEARTPKATIPSTLRFGRPDIFKALCDHPHGYHSGFYIEIEREVWGAGTELWAQSREGELGRFSVLDVTLNDEALRIRREQG